jgi:hypothetical protein
MGGVLEVVVTLFAIMVAPFAEFSFIMKAMQQLFLARTKTDSLFVKKSWKKKNNKSKFKSIKKPVPDEFKDTQIEAEAKMHYPINLEGNLKVKLFCTNMCCLNRCLSFSSKSKMGKILYLYKEGSERIENDLSIERIIKNLRDIKIVIKNTLMTEKERFRIQHNQKNVIDLDRDIDMGSSDSASNDDQHNDRQYEDWIKKARSNSKRAVKKPGKIDMMMTKMSDNSQV